VARSRRTCSTSCLFSRRYILPLGGVIRSALIRPAVTHSRIDWVLTPNKDAAWGVVSRSSAVPVLTRLLPGLGDGRLGGIQRGQQGVEGGQIVFVFSAYFLEAFPLPPKSDHP